MSLTIYLWRKPGEGRVYMSQVPIPPERRKLLRSQGYRIYALPVVFEEDEPNPPADEELKPVAAKPIEPWYLGANVVNPHGMRGKVVEVDDLFVKVRWFPEGYHRPCGDIGTFNREGFERDRLPVWIVGKQEGQ